MCCLEEVYKCNSDVVCQEQLFEFVFNSVYVDLKNNEIYVTFIAGSVCLCDVCSHVRVRG